MTSPMPTISALANDLRAAFGTADFDAGLRAQGYYAREGGRTIDTRKTILGEGIPVSRCVIGPPPVIPTKAARGR